MVECEREGISIVNEKPRQLSTSEFLPDRDILYVDNHLLVVNKPAGMLVQGDSTGDLCLLEAARTWVGETYRKPGRVYLGLVHRLDRPASGVLVFARTSKAAARLSAQFRERQVQKTYWALVEGETLPEATLTHRMERREQSSRIVRRGGQEARLHYRCVGVHQGTSLVEVDLETGRRHQIRLQLAHTGHPILGDRRYGTSREFIRGAIALHARRLTLTHPTRGIEQSFTADPDWGHFLDGFGVVLPQP